MKSLPSPPAYVYVTAKAVLILLGQCKSASEPDEKVWKKAVPLMNNPPKFLEGLVEYRGEDIE